MNYNKKNSITIVGPDQCEMRNYDSRVGRGPSSRSCNSGNKKAVIIALILLLSGVIVGIVVYFFFVAKSCPRTAGEKLIDNGICNGGVYMTDACSYDGGDCVAFNLNYPDCPIEELAESVHVNKSVIIGDGVCDSGVYMTEECGYEGNDCNECAAIIPDGTEALIGNGVCNGGVYMSEPACNMDGGDCSECANIIPNGTEALVGDGFCNGGNFMTDACGNDGGDCGTAIGSCSTIPSSPVFTTAIIAADVNNDGFVDLIIGNWDKANQLLLNAGDATGDGTTTPFQTSINLPRGDDETMKAFAMIVAADVNNDGFVDLIIGNYYGGQANQLLLNTGDATGDGTTPFQTPINLPGGKMSTYTIVAADVNNDGLVDLIIGNSYQANQLLLNTGDSFQAAINLPGRSVKTYAIIAADVNDDGYVALVIGNYIDHPNQVLLNTGDAIFRSAIDISCSSETATMSLAVADMDNDGHLDIAFANWNQQKNKLLMNLGDGISYKEPAGLGSSWLPAWNEDE